MVMKDYNATHTKLIVGRMLHRNQYGNTSTSALLLQNMCLFRCKLWRIDGGSFDG